jgi:hypothetical protein
MSAENPTPEAIWIITEETAETSNTTTETVTDSVTRSIGARSSGDTGGRLGGIQTKEEIVFTQKKGELVITRRKVEVTKIKQEMKGFLQAMREMLDEAEEPNSKM